MSRINAIQNTILELDGGTYQKILDAHLYKKYKYENIQPLGMQICTNKVTKGIPDTFIKLQDETYTLIMNATVQADSFNKLKEDIASCFNPEKIKLKKEEFRKNCAYTLLTEVLNN